MSNLQIVLDHFDNINARLEKLEANVNILTKDSNKNYDLTSVMDGIKLVAKNMTILNSKIDSIKSTNAITKSDILFEINKLHDMLNSINDTLYEMTRETEDENKEVYTDKEIYELKQQLSWNKLVQRTHMKKSTLQWHYYKYKKDNGII